MSLILFDDTNRDHLLPLVFTRPVADIRVGILTIREKWERYLGMISGTHTQPYLQQKFQEVSDQAGVLYVNGAVLPDPVLVSEVKQLKPGEQLVAGDLLVAMHSAGTGWQNRIQTDAPRVQASILPAMIRKPWDVFQMNGQAIQLDWELLQPEKSTAGYGNIQYGDALHIAPGAEVKGAILNSEGGPIYIGEGAKVMEGACLRGPVAVCAHAEVKMGAKIYGPTTIGPHSKVGGELTNVVIFGFSNKGHDGFVGNSVIGEWCNLGADTNSSNLKNNYSMVKVWSYVLNDFTDTGLQFCGLIMGDHSKTGINTMLNTGTVVGVNANIFGGDFPPKHIPSFSWGGASGFEKYDLDKAMVVAERVMERRKVRLTEADRAIFHHLYELG